MANTEEYCRGIIILGVYKLLPQVYREVFQGRYKFNKSDEKGPTLGLG